MWRRSCAPHEQDCGCAGLLWPAVLVVASYAGSGAGLKRCQKQLQVSKPPFSSITGSTKLLLRASQRHYVTIVCFCLSCLCHARDVVPLCGIHKCCSCDCPPPPPQISLDPVQSVTLAQSKDALTAALAASWRPTHEEAMLGVGLFAGAIIRTWDLVYVVTLSAQVLLSEPPIALVSLLDGVDFVFCAFVFCIAPVSACVCYCERGCGWVPQRVLSPPPACPHLHAVCTAHTAHTMCFVCTTTRCPATGISCWTMLRCMGRVAPPMSCPSPKQATSCGSSFLRATSMPIPLHTALLVPRDL